MLYFFKVMALFFGAKNTLFFKVMALFFKVFWWPFFKVMLYFFKVTALKKRCQNTLFLGPTALVSYVIISKLHMNYI